MATHQKARPALDFYRPRSWPPLPFYASLVKFMGPVDRLRHHEVRCPSMAINKCAYTPAGAGGPTLAAQPGLCKRAACADGGRLGRRDAAIPLSLGLAGMFGMTQFAIYGKLP